MKRIGVPSPASSTWSFTPSLVVMLVIGQSLSELRRQIVQRARLRYHLRQQRAELLYPWRRNGCADLHEAIAEALRVIGALADHDALPAIAFDQRFRPDAGRDGFQHQEIAVRGENRQRKPLDRRRRLTDHRLVGAVDAADLGHPFIL